jgi:hypothetical protein
MDTTRLSRKGLAWNPSTTIWSPRTPRTQPPPISSLDPVHALDLDLREETHHPRGMFTDWLRRLLLGQPHRDVRPRTRRSDKLVAWRPTQGTTPDLLALLQTSCKHASGARRHEMHRHLMRPLLGTPTYDNVDTRRDGRGGFEPLPMSLALPS